VNDDWLGSARLSSDSSLRMLLVNLESGRVLRELVLSFKKKKALMLDSYSVGGGVTARSGGPDDGSCWVTDGDGMHEQSMFSRRLASAAVCTAATDASMGEVAHLQHLLRGGTGRH